MENDTSIHFHHFITSGCVDDFETPRTGGSNGGDRKEGISKLVDCQAVCAMTSDCGAIDWVDSESKCYTHTGTNFKNAFNSGNTASKQYRRTKSCTGIYLPS